MAIRRTNLSRWLRSSGLAAASFAIALTSQGAPPLDVAMPVSTAGTGNSTADVSLDGSGAGNARALYEAMGTYLAAQQTFFVELASTTTISGGGRSKQSGGLSRVWYRRPDHVVWTTQSDIGASAMAADGINCTLYLPALKKYMVSPVTGNSDAAVAAMSAPYGMVATGIFSSRTTGSLNALLTAPPRLLQNDYVLGVLCQHLKLPTAAGEVDLWIADGSIPLPVKISSAMTIPASPGEDNAIEALTEVSFRWRVNVELPDSTFELKLPETAVKTDRLGSPVVVASSGSRDSKGSTKTKKNAKAKSSGSEKKPDSSKRKFQLAFDPPPNLNQALGLPSAMDGNGQDGVPSLKGGDNIVQAAIRRSNPDTVPSGASYQPKQEQTAPPPPSSSAPTPGIQLTMLDGRKVDISTYRGKQAVVLDFWATWCGPCKQSMPAVSAVASKYQGKGVQFFAVNMAEDSSEVQAFVQKQGLSIPVAIDSSGQIAKAFGVTGIPHLVVIGKDGTVKGTHTGADPALQQTLTRDLDVALR